MVNYLLRMMSSWAIVCSVWYLPPMSREVRANHKRCYAPCSAERAAAVYSLGCEGIIDGFLKQEGEDAVQFANRVKAAIARQGGLVDLLW